MSKFKIGEILPNRELFEKRFSFISDSILRTNIAISLRHITFLIWLVENSELPGGIEYSILKDIILHTASIVECCLNYILRKQLDNESITSRDIMSSDWSYYKTCELYNIDDDNIICGVHKRKKFKNLTKGTQFVDLIKAAKKAKVLSDSLASEVDELRAKRNNIHLASLDEVDDFYEKDDLEKVFNTARKVLEIIEHIEKD